MFNCKPNPLLPAILSAIGVLISTSTNAAAPVLANAPVNQLSLVQPNILFVLDRSGSMDSEYVPDEANAALNGKVGFTNFYCNKLAYNPNITYGIPLNDVGGYITTAPGNTLTAAYDDGYVGGTTVDLTTSGAYKFYYQLKTGVTPPTSYADTRCKEAANTVASSTNFTQVLVNTLPAAAQQNYANWFAFYRSRLMMMKGAVGKAFQTLGPEVRFGFMTIDTQKTEMTSTAKSPSWIPMATMTSSQKSTFYQYFYQIQTSGSTPLLAALSGAGLYYAGKYSHDPVLANGAGGECQRNFTILSTDGYWNNYARNPINNCSGCSADLSWTTGTVTSTNVGDIDNDPLSPYSPFTSANSGGKNDGKYDANSGTGTLADISLYYYKNDLRPTFNKIDPHRGEVVSSSYLDATGSQIKCTPYPTAVPSGGKRCLATPLYRNMTTYTVGIGVAGTLKYVGDYDDRTSTNWNSTSNDFYNLVAGTKSWPVPTSNASTTADDLWHAAVNSNGKYFSAGDPNTMAQGLSSTLGKITADTVQNVTPTTGSPALTNDNNIAYKSNFRSSSWTGRLYAVTIDPATALEAKDGLGNALAPVWSGHLLLDAQAGAYDTKTYASPPSGVTANGWDTARKIFVGSSTAGVAAPFRWANLTAAQRTALTDGVGTPANYGQLVLEYLRGSQAYEEGVTGVHGAAATAYFRGRGDDTSTTAGGDKTQGILGDLVNSKPILLKKPFEVYTDDYNPGYSAFVTAKKDRTPMVYIGANDGMLHAFNASTSGSGLTVTGGTNAGKEEWAYVPSMILNNGTDEDGKKSGLQSYSYPIGGNPALGIPKFTKHFFVDGTPRINDVDFNRTGSNAAGTSGSPDWRSLLIGSLGKGGKGYFALDVTDGANPSTETTAASKFVWEFTGDADMGYSFGNAVISRSKYYGWVVLVPSGMNNSTGFGAIWMLNAKTGAVIKKFTIANSCTVGDNACYAEGGLSATNPLNLNKVVGYVLNTASEQLLAVYAGDMQGNVWRIDMKDEVTPGNWTLRKLAKLALPTPAGADSTSAYGTTNQPITTSPQVRWDIDTDRRWVFVGTGEDLSADDRIATKVQSKQQQSMYAIVDGTGANPLVDASLPVTRSTLAAASATSIASVDITGKNGWYMDLAKASGGNLAERIVLQPVALFGTVVFATNIPVTDVCSPSYSGVLYARGYVGAQIGASMMQVGANTVASIASSEGFASNPGLVQTIDGNTIIQATTLKGGVVQATPTFKPSTHRTAVSWRELFNN